MLMERSGLGWSDINGGFVYNLSLAKLQGQINSAASGSTANALKTFMAFIALCLAAVFAL
jgi:uncharacterized MAPEG superfamily protein